MTDSIADMLSRIRNALMARKGEVMVPHSKLKEAIARILAESGYIESYRVEDVIPQKEIHIVLKYVGKIPAISTIRRVSRPGRRAYGKAQQLPKSLGGYGLTIISTNKGVMTDSQARKQNVGGELICQVW